MELQFPAATAKRIVFSVNAVVADVLIRGHDLTHYATVSRPRVC